MAFKLDSYQENLFDWNFSNTLLWQGTITLIITHVHVLPEEIIDDRQTLAEVMAW